MKSIPTIKPMFSWLLVLACLLPVSLFSQNTLFFEDFSTGSLSQDWTARPNLSGSNGIVDVIVDEGIARNGDYALRIAKSSSQGGFTTNSADLTIDLTGKSNVEMTFWIKHRYDETQTEDGLYFSNDGGINFVKAIDFLPSDWCPQQYGKLPPVRISEQFSQLFPGSTLGSLIIRFQQKGEQNVNSDGFYIDDLRIYESELSYFSVGNSTPFFDDFESGSLSKYWAVRYADSTAINLSGGPINRISSWTEVLPNEGNNSTYALSFKKRCDDGYTTQVGDLHLDLKSGIDYELLFDIKHSYDETDLDDAIFISNDAGRHFEKIFQFEPSDWCVYQYGRLPPLNITKLAANVGVQLTSNTIIRFQHRSNRSNSEFIFIDNLKIQEANYEFANLPFTEGFELGVLRPMWKKSFADATSVINTGVPTTRPSTMVEVRSDAGRSPSTYGLAFGKSCDDGFGTSCIDLQGQSDVVMTCYLSNRNDETQLDDGIYFSDDNGRNFTKVESLDWSNTVRYTYQEKPIRISELIQANNLSHTDSFIIRFQQHGDRAFNSDGFYLDDINITGRATSIEPEKPRSFTVWPNPVKDLLNIETIDRGGRFTITISNSVGQKVYSQSLYSQPSGSRKINLSQLPQGTYFLSVESGKAPIENFVLYKID